MRPRKARASYVALVLTLSVVGSNAAQTREQTPIRQSTLTATSAVVEPLTLRDAARDDRWFGLGVRDVRWAPDGKVVYFRWNRRPSADDVPDADPWFRADRSGAWVEEVPAGESEFVPAADIDWSADGRRAAWISENAVYLYDQGQNPTVRRAIGLTEAPRRARIAEHGSAVHFETAEALYRYEIETGTLGVLAKHVTVDPESLPRKRLGSPTNSASFSSAFASRKTGANALQLWSEPQPPGRRPFRSPLRRASTTCR